MSELLDEIEKNPIDMSAYGLCPGIETGDIPYDSFIFPKRRIRDPRPGALPGP